MDVDTVMETVMGRTGQGQHITYDEVQLEAIRAAVSSKIMVLTGGPDLLPFVDAVGIHDDTAALGLPEDPA